MSKEYIDLMRKPQLSSYKHEDQFGCTCGADYDAVLEWMEKHGEEDI